MRQRLSSTPWRRLGACALLCFALATTGCGKTGKVTGDVSFDGKPVKAGRITFLGPDGKEAVGSIQDGHYEVEKVPLGDCKVTVTSLSPGNSGMPGAGGPGGMPGMGGPGGMPGMTQREMDPSQREKLLREMEKSNPEMAKQMRESQEMQSSFVQLPEDYANPEKSGLKHTVTRGSTTFDIALVKPKGWKPQKLSDMMKQGKRPRQ